MNILVLSWRGPGHPSAGGAEQVTLEHAKGWARAGHEVILFTSCFKGASLHENAYGIEIKRSGDQYIGVKIKAFFWYLFGNHPKFDLVIDEFHGIPFFTPLYVRVHKLGLIHEVAGEVWKYNTWPKPINIIPKYFGAIFEPWIFRFIYKNIHFMTVSNSTRSDLVSFGIPKANITLIYNGVKLNLPKKLSDKENKKTAMYLGAISEDKGTFDAIRAFGQIERKDDGWQYWLVGSGTKEYLKKLREIAKEAGVEPKLKIWGFVPDNRKFDLLARAHVLINPSYHEGWGLVNIESNSVGTPVVAYNVHGLRDSIKPQETGILVDKGDYRALGEEALKLVRDKKRYERFQKFCMAWSKKFTWDKSCKESLKLIENI